MSPGTPARDRRRFPRTVANLRTSVAPTGQDARSAVIRDLSPSGAFVQTAELEPVGTRLILRVPLHDEFGGNQWLEGRVVRLVDVRDREGGGMTTIGMGVEFRVSDAQREGLQRLIDGIVAVVRDGAPRIPTLPPGTEFVAEAPGTGGTATATPRLVLVARAPTLQPASGSPAAGPPAGPRRSQIEPTQRITTIPPAAEPAKPSDVERKLAALPAPEPPPAGVEETMVRIDALRCGQARSARVPLRAPEPAGNAPPAVLEARLFCTKASSSYQLELRPDLGARPPGFAAVRVWTGDEEGSPPLPIVRNGTPRDQELSLEIPPAATRIALTVHTDGSRNWPMRLHGGIRLLRAGAENGCTNDTRRLPGKRVVAKIELGNALRSCPVPALALLGRLMTSSRLADKIDLLRQLVDVNPDVRLLEAGVQDMRASARLEETPEPIDFESLSLQEPAGAAIVIFHPDSPNHLLSIRFTLCLEGNLTSARDRDSALWRQLAKAGAVALWRRDRKALEDLSATLKASEDPVKAVVLEKLIQWASRRTRASRDEPREPLDVQLTRIRTAAPEVALATALESLADHGFVVVARDLTPPGE